MSHNFSHTFQNSLPQKQKVLIGIILFLISAIAWITTLKQSSDMELMMKQFTKPVGFIFIWTIMMTAMMLPSVYPAIIIFANACQSRLQFGVKPASTWLFISGYIIAWTGFGLIAYIGNEIVVKFLDASIFIGGWKSTFAGAIFILSGLYQFTKLKSACLNHCRSPIIFLMHSWKDGKIGAVWMGIQHGAYCIVCCFGLMVILFLLGIMSILWMLVISFIVFIEKVNKHGELIARIIGVIMFICGLVIVLGLLPWWGTMM